MKSLLARIMNISKPSGIDFEIYTDKMAESARRVIRRAYEQARSRGHNQMRPEHILLAISETEQPMFDDLIRGLQLDPQTIKMMIEMKLSHAESAGSGMEVSDSLRRVFASSLNQARGDGRMLIESIDLFAGVFIDGENTASEIMRNLGANGQKVVRAIEKLKR